MSNLDYLNVIAEIASIISLGVSLFALNKILHIQTLITTDKKGNQTAKNISNSLINQKQEIK